MRKQNSKMRQRSFGTAMGITSIIAILVILVLVVFSILSLITSKADLTLSQKTSDNIEAYYNADYKAENILAEFGDKIASGTSEEYAKSNNYEYYNSTLKFSVPIDDSRELKVEVKYNSNGKVIEKQLWQVSPTKEWKKDNQVQLYQP